MTPAPPFAGSPVIPAPPRTATPSPDSGRGTTRAARAPTTASPGSWIAVGVRGRVAAFQPDLVRALSLEPDEEARGDGDSTLRIGVDLDHPALDAVRVELGIPAGIER